MFKRENLTIPNCLSLSRIVFLPALFALVWLEMPLAFTILYAVIGSTDLWDGMIARRLNQKTDLGKSLDSIADLFFYLSTAYFIHALYAVYLEPNLILLYVFLSFLALSFVVSAIRCKKPILMHTVLLKLCAVLVYALMIFSYFFDTTRFITAILFIYFVAFTEEIAIFIKYGEVDPDTPFLFSLMKR